MARGAGQTLMNAPYIDAMGCLGGLPGRRRMTAAAAAGKVISRRFMTAGASVGCRGVIHLRRFPVRLIVTPQAVVDCGSAMGALMTTGTSPLSGGIAGETVARMAAETLKTGMSAGQLAGMIR